MKFKGKIDNINNIVISDPIYDEETLCRYERSNINAKDWIASLNIYPISIKIDDYDIKGVEFFLLLQANDKVCNLNNDGTFEYLKNIKLKNYTIGIDSACVALGINDKAKEIIDSQEEWQPLCAIRTGGDGTFGEVYEGIKNGKLCFLLIRGCFDEYFINQNELFEYLKKQFQIKELINEDVVDIDNHVLKKGDMVEVSSCIITNDIDGSKIIKNSNFKDEIDKMNLKIEKANGIVEHTIIEPYDSLVNLPIKVVVIDCFYDYEAGYKYKGKITNKDLINEFKKIGFTGIKPTNYKNHNKSLYKDSLKAHKNYNPSIVYFSEFDVIKILKKNKNQEMEI